MTAAIVEFTAQGSARALASAIEQYAAQRRIVSAQVVPWESDAVTLRMSVTSPRGDGWAIEHTNLGTISLADLGGEQTRVVVASHDAQAAADAQAMLTAFARQIQKQFGQP